MVVVGLELGLGCAAGGGGSAIVDLIPGDRPVVVK